MREKPTYEADYIQNYDDNNADKTLSGLFLRKSHRLLEESIPDSQKFETILEVGAGSGHHFPFVSRNFEKYIMTDGSPEMLRISAEKYNKEVAAGEILIEQQDATSLTYSDNSMDRLIATHVLEHLTDPVEVLREWNRVVRPGGLISIVLPCDPGFLWRLGRNFGPRRNAQRLGLAYDYLQAAEHVNSIFNLVTFIRHHFEDLIEKWYPSKLPVPDLNLFYACHLKVSDD